MSDLDDTMLRAIIEEALKQRDLTHITPSPRLYQQPNMNNQTLKRKGKGNREKFEDYQAKPRTRHDI